MHINSQKNTNLKMSNLHMAKVENVCIIEGKYHKLQGVETWLINYYGHLYTKLFESCVLALLKQHIYTSWCGCNKAGNWKGRDMCHTTTIFGNTDFSISPQCLMNTVGYLSQRPKDKK